MVFTDHGVPAMEDIPPASGPVRRGFSGSHTALFRILQDTGLYATDLPGELARHQGLPVSTVGLVVPHGHSLVREVRSAG